MISKVYLCHGGRLDKINSSYPIFYVRYAGHSILCRTGWLLFLICYTFCCTSFFYAAYNGTHGQCKEGHPVPEDDQIKLMVIYIPECFNPCPWIQRVNHSSDGEIPRSRLLTVLRFSREEKIRVLKRKRHYLCVMAHLIKRST